MSKREETRASGAREPERELVLLRPRGHSVVVPTAVFLALVLLSFYFCAQFDSVFQRVVIVSGASALALLLCAPPVLRWACIRYRITSRRILARRGAVRVRRGELAYTSDLRVAVSRTVAQRATRCGDVRVSRAEVDIFVLRDLPDPELVATVLREQIVLALEPEPGAFSSGLGPGAV